LNLKNPFLPGEIFHDETGILDILMQMKSGRQIDVEIQAASHAAFQARILYCLARLFGNRIGEGESCRFLKPVLGIVITDFVWIADSAAYHNAYRLYDSQSGSLFSEDLLPARAGTAEGGGRGRAHGVVGVARISSIDQCIAYRLEHFRLKC
jgi:predicted transposase/invertase (TIGR01784 family)